MSTPGTEVAKGSAYNLKNNFKQISNILELFKRQTQFSCPRQCIKKLEIFSPYGKGLELKMIETENYLLDI